MKHLGEAGKVYWNMLDRTNVAKIEFRSDRSVATMVLTIKNDSMEILM